MITIKRFLRFILVCALIITILFLILGAAPVNKASMKAEKQKKSSTDQENKVYEDAESPAPVMQKETKLIRSEKMKLHVKETPEGEKYYTIENTTEEVSQDLKVDSKLQLPNLTAPSCSFKSWDVTEGESYWIRENIRNAGDVTAGPSHANLWLSTDNDWNTSDDYDLGDKSVPGIPAFSTVSVQWTFNFPNIGSGDYDVWFLCLVDCDNEVFESNENDNLWKTNNPITAHDAVADLPDLVPYRPSGWDDIIVVSSVTGTHTDGPELCVDEPIYYDYAYLNDSDVDITETFRNRIYVDGSLVFTSVKNGLQAGHYGYGADRVVTISTPGTHNISMDVDYFDDVEEEDEGNNDYDRDFEVSDCADCWITINSPNGGEVWYEQSTHDIRWTSQGTSGTVEIWLSFDSGQSWQIIENVTDDGTYSWTLPSVDKDETNCRLRIRDAENQRCWDRSNNDFTIKNQECSINITSPNGGEVWDENSTHNILWTSNNTSGDVKIKYSLNSGASWTTIVFSLTDNGIYSWTLPSVDKDETNCRVKVEDVSNSQCMDMSDRDFTIKDKDYCSINVTSPNGGEVWNENSTHNILWTSQNTSGSVKISYSLNSGASWTIIVYSVTDNGIYPWTLPSVNKDETNCRVKVEDVSNPQCMDMSDRNFTIKDSPSCPLTVLVPNCRVVWKAGTSHRISWIPAGRSGQVKIEYSTNGGTSWITIVGSTPDDGCECWDIPNGIISSHQCLIKITDLGDASCYDESDALFTIGTALTPYVVATDISGSADTRLTVDINIGGNIQEIDAISFDLSYDTNHLDFVEVQKGDLTSTWTMLQGTESRPGVIHGMGYSAFNKIPTGSYGSIAKVVFNIACRGCNECDQSHLSWLSLADDLANMNGYCGTYSYSGCGSRCTCGDVTNDGNFTAEDALCAFMIGLNGGRIPPGFPECNNECALEAADVDGNGSITAEDARGIFLRGLNGYWEPGFCETSLAKAQPSSVEVTYLSLDDVYGQPGDIVKIPIVVDNPQGITAFGLELRYPQDLLEFVDVARTSVTEEWITLAGNEIEAGSIIVSGFHYEPISNPSSAAIAEIILIVRPGATGEGRLFIGDLMDDLAGVMYKEASFSTDMSKILPASYELEQNYPNPFNMETEILYNIPEAGPVKVIVYNVSGQKIKTLVDANIQAGKHKVRWNGKDELGENISSGIYIYKLETYNVVLSKKLILLK